MTTQLCSRVRVAAFRVGISAVAVLLVLVVRERAMARPVFAQAYGTACLTHMPMLNAFGRHTLDDDGAAVLGEVHGASQGRLPNIDVGSHKYALDYVGGQWGTIGNATGVSPFGDAHDYGADTPLQWRVAHADPAKAYEVGTLGLSGSALISVVRVDNYNVAASETKSDSRPGSPSFLCQYATATDSNPGYLSPRVASNPSRSAGSIASSWRIGSARQMVEHDHVAMTFSYYQTNQALGEIGITRLIPPTGIQTGGGPGFSYAINPYTRFYTTVSLRNQRPALSILMRLKP